MRVTVLCIVNLKSLEEFKTYQNNKGLANNKEVFRQILTDLCLVVGY